MTVGSASATEGAGPSHDGRTCRHAYHREGSVYVTRPDILMEDRSLYGTRLGGCAGGPNRSVNIDEPEDWERAEALVQAQARLSGIRN